MKVRMSTIRAIRPTGVIRTESMTKHTADINRSIEKNITINETKIAQGLKKAQRIQTK